MLASAVLALALAAEADPPSVRALRVDGRMRLDGRLDDPAWAAAEPASGFRQREPREGAPATEDTEVRLLFDSETLFVGVRARDREPEAVISRLLLRDRVIQPGFGADFEYGSDDLVAILLDPFEDHRNGFVFAANPNGAEFEALVTDESLALNVDWRAVWRVAACRTSDGWSAEFAIPFASLRYPRGGDEGHRWGLNVLRLIRRRSEEALWSGWSKAEGGLHRVSQAGHLLGLHDLPRSRLNLEVKPYGLGGLSRELQDDGSTPRETEAALGLDAKWELRPGMVLDATVNPDFAQVEVDDQVVNMTRFDLFLPEKRDFFLENAGIFDLGYREVGNPAPPFLLFFSRRIGISEDEGEIPVLGGFRLSGRAGRQTVGVLGLATDAAFEEPRTAFTAVRVKRDVGSRGFLGAMLTDRRSRSDAETDGAVDFSLWPARGLNVSGFAAWTSAAGGRGADRAWRLGAEYRSRRVWAQANQLEIGPDAETGMGFVARTDVRQTNGFFVWIARPSLLGLRSVEPFVGGTWITRTTGERQDGNAFGGAFVNWISGEQLVVFGVKGTTWLDEEFALADRIPVPTGPYDVGLLTAELQTSPKRPLSCSLQVQSGRQWGGAVTQSRVEAAVAAGPHLSVGPTWTLSAADLPEGSFTAHVVGVRATWAFSTRLVARAYVQYNSLERKWITNLRLNFIHRPGSDLFVVFNDDEGEEGAPGRLVSRGLVVKGTWLIRF